MVGPKWTGGGSKMDPNNKDNNKDYNKSNYLPTYDLRAEEETKRISVLGKTGVVRMTFHQYACLVSLILPYYSLSIIHHSGRHCRDEHRSSA